MGYSFHMQIDGYVIVCRNIGQKEKQGVVWWRLDKMVGFGHTQVEGSHLAKGHGSDRDEFLGLLRELGTKFRTYPLQK